MLRSSARPLIDTLKQHFIPLAVTLLTSAVVITWFRGYVLYQWDSVFPFNPPAAIRSYFWPWSDLVSTGVPLLGNTALPYFASVYLLHNLLGLSFLASQVILYYSLLGMAGVSMYFLLVNQSGFKFRNSRPLKFGAIGAAMVYMFNPYSMIYNWEIFSLESFLYATLPLIFLLFQRGLTVCDERTDWKAIVGIGAITVFAAPAIGNPAFAIPLVFGFLIFYATWLINPGNLAKRSGSIRFVLLSAVSLLAMNIWWIYPTVLLSQSQLVRAGGSAYAAVGLADLMSNSLHSNLFNVFRLAGIPAFYRSSAYPQFPYAWVYHSSFAPMVLVSLCLPLMAFAALMYRVPSFDRTTLIFSAVSIVTIIPLAAGLQPPFGAIYGWLTAIPALSVLFRDPYQKFGFWLPFGYSILAGAAFFTMANGTTMFTRSHRSTKSLKRPNLSKKRAVALLMILLSISIGYSWPMATGDLIPEKTSTVPSARVEIPQYYLEAAAWLESQKGPFRIISLPKDQILQSSNWTNGYAGIDVLRLLTGDSIISTDSQVPTLDAFQRGLYEYIYAGGDNLTAVLRILNVRFVLLRMDAGFYPAVTQPVNLDILRSYLENQPGLSVASSFGSLTFFGVDEIGPRMFATSRVFTLQELDRVGWNLTSYDGGWQPQGLTVSETGSTLWLAFKSPGTYSSGYVSSIQALNISTRNYPYLRVDFSSSPNAALLLHVGFKNQTSLWLTAIDTGAGTPYMGNHYSSVQRTELTYDLTKVPDPLKSIDIYITNAPQAASESNATVTIYGLTFESLVGLPQDYVRAIANSNLDSSSYTIVDQSDSPRATVDPPPVVAYEQISPVEYKVQVTGASGPFVLVLGETFDPLWHLSVGFGYDISKAVHVLVDGFANGWMISSGGTFTFWVSYGPSQSFVLAYFLSLWSGMGLFALAVGNRHRSQDSKRAPRSATNPSAEDETMPRLTRLI